MIRLLADRTLALAALVLLLSVAGAFVAARMPAAIFPEVTFPVVKVIAEAGDAPAEQVIPSVTRPIEEAVRRVPGARTVRSMTSRGSTELSVLFDWGSDMPMGLQRIQAEMARIRPELPDGTQIGVEWMSPTSFPILGYALTSDTVSQASLRAYAEFVLKPAFLGVPGVSEIQVQGGFEREFQVWLDPSALQARGLTPGNVVETLRRQRQALSAGLIEENHELYLALVDGRLDSVEALSALAIPLDDAPPVRLDTLGTVEMADQVSYVRTTADGQPAVLLNVIGQPSSNTLSIASGIDALLAEPDLVPEGFHLSTFYDQARFVRASVHGTRDAIVIGVVLAALVLVAFLRKLRPAVVTVAVIPLTVAIVALPLGATGQTINLMTMAGIAAAIGLVADDAIVVVEHLEHHPDARDLSDLLPALLGSSLSTTVILVPFALLSGVVGAFFRPLALTMALALAVSFFVAWLLVPALAGRGRAATTPGPGSTDTFFGRFYTRLVGLIVRHPSLAFLGLVVLVTASVFEYRAVGTDFLPAMDQGSIIMDYWTPPGTSLADTDAMLRDAEAALDTVPDVASWSRRTGTELGFYVTEPNTGDYVINLKPRSERRPVDEVIDDIRARVVAVEPAIDVDFGQLIEDEIGDLSGGSPQPIDIRVFGDDAVRLADTARHIAALIDEVPGVEDVFDGITISGPVLRVVVDPVEAARRRLDTESVHEALEPFLAGTVVDQVRVGERLFDLRVLSRATGPLSDLQIRTPDGELARVGTMADLRTGAREAEIDREDLRTFIGVTARLSGRDLGSAMADIHAALRDGLQLAPDQHLQYGGLYEQQQQSFRGLLEVLLAGLGLVGIVVLFEFGDWRAPLLVAASAVAVLAGVLGALILTGTTLDISSFVGAIMMVGIVGENAIFVIHDARSRLREDAPVLEAWIGASRRRVRPVAMTVLATAFALFPLALGIGEGAQLVRPLAIAVIGGFLVSGPIVLFLLPSLYAALDPRGRLGGRISSATVP